MKLIAHRGNTHGPKPDRENSIDYIEEAITEGYDVEIDLRLVNNICYLGHDDPLYSVSMEWLRQYKDLLWIHCKNHAAMEKMSSSAVQFNYFWHETDSYTITSKGIGWVYPGRLPYSKSVIVMPENVCGDIKTLKEHVCYGICSDYVGELT
jgi:hypothetical protein